MISPPDDSSNTSVRGARLRSCFAPREKSNSVPTVDTANWPWLTDVGSAAANLGRAARGSVAPRKMACRAAAGRRFIRGSRSSTRARGAWSPAGGPLLFWGAGGGLLSDQTHPVVRFSQSLQKSLNRAGASAVARPSARRRRRCISVRSAGLLPEIHLRFRRFFRYRTLIVVGAA